eukprot:COSAG01_NODE_63139_length_281_cov_0.835165_2_plen_32_part_01
MYISKGTHSTRDFFVAGASVTTAEAGRAPGLG